MKTTDVEITAALLAAETAIAAHDALPAGYFDRTRTQIATKRAARDVAVKAAIELRALVRGTEEVMRSWRETVAREPLEQRIAEVLRFAELHGPTEASPAEGDRESV